jgi:hypothetical protein
MAKSILDRVLAVMLIVAVLVVTYLGIVGFLWFREKQMPMSFNQTLDYIEARQILEDERDYSYKFESKKSYRNKVKKITGLKFYIYNEKRLDILGGYAYAPIRTIEIDDRLSGYGYCLAFMHEAIHIAECIGNENYVSYMTFIKLYESEELHQIGVMYGISQLEGTEKQYNIVDYVVSYLTNK